jgi:hypothetical protein
MHAKIIARGDDGTPLRVETFDGYAHVCREYQLADSWIDKQLSPADFPAVQIGRDTEYLVDLVNKLQRKVASLELQVESYRKAAGF